MDLSFINDYISIVTLAICLAVGFIIKTSFNNKKLNQFIPLISGVLGVLIYAWSVNGLTPEGLATGLVTGLAATGLYEAVKDILGLRESTDDEPEGEHAA